MFRGKNDGKRRVLKTFIMQKGGKTILETGDENNHVEEDS